MTRSRRGAARDTSWTRPEPLVERAPDRVFKLTELQRRNIARYLKYIDQARNALEAQHNADNREIIRELRESADRIFDLLNDLEEGD